MVISINCNEKTKFLSIISKTISGYPSLLNNISNTLYIVSLNKIFNFDNSKYESLVIISPSFAKQRKERSNIFLQKYLYYFQYIYNIL